MRSLFIAAVAATTAAAALAACATAPGPPQRSVQAQQQFDRLLAGKVAGPPQSCLPSYRAQDMEVIDGRTILFRDGANRVWQANIRGGDCEPLERIGYALVTRNLGTSGLCSGDISTVVDTATGMFAGSCSFDSFTPYTTPGRR